MLEHLDAFIHPRMNPKVDSSVQGPAIAQDEAATVHDLMVHPLKFHVTFPAMVPAGQYLVTVNPDGTFEVEDVAPRKGTITLHFPGTEYTPARDVEIKLGSPGEQPGERPLPASARGSPAGGA